MGFTDQFSQLRLYNNTGVNAAHLVPGLIHKIFWVPKKKQFTQTETQSMYATMQALISHATDSLRCYPMGNFVSMEDKSTQATINTSGYNTSIFVKDGKFHFELAFHAGGVQLYNKIRKMFHNAQHLFDLVILDKDTNTLIGTKPVLNTSNYTFKGLTPELIYVDKFTWNSGNDLTTFKIGFVLADTDELIERIAIVQVPDSQPLLALDGLLDLEFNTYPQPYQVLTSSVAKVRITTGGGATDLFDLYGSALAALSANFTFKDASNNTLTCTVTAEAATKTMVFTFSGAAYTALSSGAIISCWSPTIAQMTATIPGFANSYFELTK